MAQRYYHAHETNRAEEWRACRWQALDGVYLVI